MKYNRDMPLNQTKKSVKMISTRTIKIKSYQKINTKENSIIL